jgi:hypothetical protein
MHRRRRGDVVASVVVEEQQKEEEEEEGEEEDAVSETRTLGALVSCFCTICFLRALFRY